MKKLINEPENIVDELIEGFIAVNRNKIKRIGEKTIVARTDTPIKGKTGIVIGGGAGHEPGSLEYIGKGMADVEVHGQIFTAPSSALCLEGIKAADGEAGIKKVPFEKADIIAETILDLIIKDLPFNKGDEVVAVVNSYGATTRMELFIIARKIDIYLKEKGISSFSIEVGEFVTSQEMSGISISLIRLNQEMKKFYKMPADRPAYKRV